MSSSLPTPPAARPAPRSLVLLRPTGTLELAAVLLGGVLLAANGLKLLAGYPPWRNGPGSLLGLGLLLRAGYLLACGNRPRLLTIDRETLCLEPLSPGPARLAETIPLSRIVAYTYWMRLLKFRAFAQYHLRLELADGRVLHLADRPGVRPHDPAGTVRLNVLAQRLARRGKSGPVRRPLFYQTPAARVLLWLSWGRWRWAWVAGTGRFGGLAAAVCGGGLYYLGRGTAELTEQAVSAFHHTHFRLMNAHELARRKPVWLALSEFYLDTELQPADFRRIRAVFDQSGYSERAIRQIDYEEVGPVLCANLLSVAGEWAGFDEESLLVAVARRADEKLKSKRLFLLKWLWQWKINLLNDAYFQRVFVA